MRNEGIDGRLQLAFHHFGELMISKPDAVVGKPVLRKVVSADLLAAIATAHLLLTFFGQSLLLLFHFDFVKPGTQHTHRLLAILDLRFFVLAAHYCVCRQVSDADGRVSRVHRLPTGSGGAEGIDAYG